MVVLYYRTERTDGNSPRSELYSSGLLACYVFCVGDCLGLWLSYYVENVKNLGSDVFYIAQKCENRPRGYLRTADEANLLFVSTFFFISVGC